MCGRYSLARPVAKEILKNPEAHASLNIARYNIAPGQFCPVVLQTAPDGIDYLRWGLIPHWAKDAKVAYKMINARSETLSSKPAFKDALESRRCIVLADGFYEWKSIGKIKQPFRITLSNEMPFYFAGLHDSWLQADGRTLSTFTVITTRPNELMLDIHDRMPVMLDQAGAEAWLSAGKDQLAEFFEPYDATRMQAWPVSPSLNSPQNDHAGLIDRFEPPPTLF